MAAELFPNRRHSGREWGGVAVEGCCMPVQGTPESGVTLDHRGPNSGYSRPPVRVGIGASGDAGHGRISAWTPPGKLKIWKTGNLTCIPMSQRARISDFQDFRFSPASAAPEIPTNELDLGGGMECPE